MIFEITMQCVCVRFNLRTSCLFVMQLGMNSTPLHDFSAPFFKISAIRNNSVICDLVMWEGGDTRPLRNDVWYSTLEKCNILLKHFLWN